VVDELAGGDGLVSTRRDEEGFFMWLKRMIRKLCRRRVAWLVDRALSVLQERLFDFRYGTDTVTFAELGSLTIVGQHAAEGTDYQPARLRVVRRALSALNPPPGSAFVDFGCGKGRVLLLAADYGFQRITGVEFAQELCGIARDNLARFRSKRDIPTDICIVEGDAVEYAIQDDENVFFLSNPFGESLVEKVIQNIARSAAVAKRQVFVIYNNPLWHNVVERQGFLTLLSLDFGECVIYTNKQKAK
jgi:SAM-dependent methyltransferase